MSYLYTNNLVPTGGFAQVIGTLCNLMQSAGWTVHKWSDATTVTTGNGSTITFNSTSLNASGAWVIMQQPTGGSVPYSGSRQILFWRRSTDASWHINYSKGGNYTTGTGSTATNPPSASDEKSTYAEDSAYSGPRSNPYDLIQSSYGPLTRDIVFQLGVSDTAPFVVWMVGYNKAQGNNSENTMNMFWMFEGLQLNSFPLDAGNNTVYTTDQDPHVFFNRLYQSSAILADYYGGMTGGQSYTFVFTGQSGQTWKNNSLMFSRPRTGYNHITSKVDLVPLLVGGTSSSYELKGLTSTVRFVTKELAGLTLLDGTDTDDRIVYGDICLPWDITATPTP